MKENKRTKLIHEMEKRNKALKLLVESKEEICYQENMVQSILENLREQYKSDIGFLGRVDRIQQSIEEVKVFKDKRMEEIEDRLRLEGKQLENTIEEYQQEELWG